MNRTCSINIPQGFEVGYSTALASAESKFTLKNGTHYLLARNGRGKTTLLRTLAGCLVSVNGSAELTGRVQFVPEDIEYNDYLSAQVILNVLVSKGRHEECFAFADRIELDLKKNYKNLSTGNKRKVSWLMAEFSCDLDAGNVLLLDEPFTGLDSYVRDAFLDYWSERDDGICRLVSCHPDFDSMAINSAVLISDGEITSASSDQGNSWGALKDGLK